MALKASLQKRIPFAFGAYHFLLAGAGARMHQDPSRGIFVIGITGTKGKTTTLEILNAILEAAGKKTAILSSIRMKIADGTKKNPTGNSMPGRGAIQKFLRDARRAHCGYALIEVTSQGVVQHRHRFINWNMGVLTNLAPEHIESHGSFEKYRAAKLAFLNYVLAKRGMVFLNRDDKNFSFFAEALAYGDEKVIEYSRTDERFQDHVERIKHVFDRKEESSPNFLLSDFNQENVAVAVATAKELGITDRTIEDALIEFKGVPGRMDVVSDSRYTAIVDYAHTPESLEAAYKAARVQLDNPSNLEPSTEGGSTSGGQTSPRLICVLGAAGGGRDKWKRPEMGKIAGYYCDEIILTDEDPYDEPPQAIIDEVANGLTQMPYPRPEVLKILDRREALAKAIDMMQEGDVVIATGKGSEEWIHLARGKKIPWNEKAIVQELLIAKNAE